MDPFYFFCLTIFTYGFIRFNRNRFIAFLEKEESLDKLLFFLQIVETWDHFFPFDFADNLDTTWGSFYREDIFDMPEINTNHQFLWYFILVEYVDCIDIHG